MIPKIIHYCWFGKADIPEEFVNYIDGWKLKMPDYTFMFWHEDNTPARYRYILNSLAKKKYANCSNLVRLLLLYEFGGIYLDTDVEVLKPLDELLQKDFFCGEEPNDNRRLVNDAVIGSIARHPVLKACILQCFKQYNGWEESNLSAPILVTQELRKYLVQYGNEDQKIGVYPREYFYPYGWTEQLSDAVITLDTHTIHHWSHTWKEAPVQPNVLRRGLEKGGRLMSSFRRALARFNERKADFERRVMLETYQEVINIALQHGNTELVFTADDHPWKKVLIGYTDDLKKAYAEVVSHSINNKLCVMSLVTSSTYSSQTQTLSRLNADRDVVFAIVDQYTPFSISNDTTEFGASELRIELRKRGWEIMTFNHPVRDEPNGEPNHLLLICGVPEIKWNLDEA